MSKSKRPDTARIVEVVLSSRTQADAAAILGVDPKTLYKYVHRPDVHAALDEARRDSLRTTLTRMHGLLGQALDAIERCLQADQPSGVQLHAAKILLENVTRASDALDLDARLAALERHVQRPVPSHLSPPQYEVKITSSSADDEDD